MEAIDGQVHRIDAETFLFSPAQGHVEHWPLSA
jgi:FtsZ-interacting cell division protein YlmF